jgi:hypothetical protein
LLPLVNLLELKFIFWVGSGTGVSAWGSAVDSAGDSGCSDFLSV